MESPNITRRDLNPRPPLCEKGALSGPSYVGTCLPLSNLPITNRYLTRGLILSVRGWEDAPCPMGSAGFEPIDGASSRHNAVLDREVGFGPD